MGPVHLSIVLTVRSPSFNDIAICISLVDARSLRTVRIGITAVNNVEEVVGPIGQPPWPAKRFGLPLRQELPLRIEQLNAAVASVGNVYSPVSVNGDTVREVEFTRTGTFVTPLK